MGNQIYSSRVVNPKFCQELRDPAEQVTLMGELHYLRGLK